MPRQRQTTRARETRPQAVHFGMFDGIRNNVPRTDIKPTDLYAAMNLDIDRNGRLSLCPGLTFRFAGAGYHSPYSTDDICLCVKDGDLVSIGTDFSLGATLRAYVGDAPMSYAAHNGIVYYTNTYCIGYVKDGVSYDLAPADGRFKITTPSGSIIGYFNGSMYVCDGQNLWITDPLRFNTVTLPHDGFPGGFKRFPAEIVLFAPVDDGIYISTTEKIYFLSGTNPNEMTQRVVQDAPAKPRSFTYVDSKLWGGRKEDYLYGKIVVMDTTAGMCWGTNNGVFGNVTARKYDSPAGTQGAMIFVRGDINQVLCSTF